jgi:hypothetical protein
MNFIDFKSLAKAIVAERFSPNKKPQRDMLGSCFAHGLSHEEAESEILVQLYVKSYYSQSSYHADPSRLGGLDTTATAIHAILLQLSTNPRVLEKFLTEIATHSPNSRSGGSEAKSTPYLQAIIN